MSDQSGMQVDRWVTVFEKVFEASFCFRVVTLLFFCHWAANQVFEVSLWASDWRLSPGLLLALTAGFTCYCAILAPLLSTLLRVFSWMVLFSSWMPSSCRDFLIGIHATPEKDEVSFWTVKDRALREKDSFWIKRVDEIENRWTAELEDQTRQQHMFFAFVFAFCIDAIWGPGLIAIALEKVPAELQKLITVPLLNFFIAALLGWAWLRIAFADHPPTRLKHPQMEDEKRQEWEKRKKEDHERDLRSRKRD
jgi:hypothetical protein